MSIMGKFCKHCRKIMKKPKSTHCSDECLFTNIKKSKSLDRTSKGAETWGKNSDPWK
jgi:hypothetical protein